MKRLLIISVVAAIAFSNCGCKKFLNINPQSDLSGNNFWRTRADVERYVNGLYELFRESVFRKDMTSPPGTDDLPFFAWAGDMRGAPVVQNPYADRPYISALASNNVKTVVYSLPSGYSTYFVAIRFAQWDRFFKLVASANIAVDRIPSVSDPALSDADKKRYKAEAIFLRNLAYFFMVRQWGDIPYYTQPYFDGKLARENQVSVLNKCLNDLGAIEQDLPWTYSDPTLIAVRGMRGSAIVLMMHINMWLAGFDAANAQTYYANTDKLANELLTQNNGAYQLLPLSQTKIIFKGRSKEGLFEIPQNVNYGESFGYCQFSDNVLYAPYKHYTITNSYLSYQPAFMQKIFPQGQPDLRATTWYDPSNMYSGGNKFIMYKFANVYANQNAEDVNPDDNQTVFRLPDVYLLQAEALYNMGKEDSARAAMNVVRARAQATPITSSVTGNDLNDAIFYERCREFMGEGLYWYDVVRTRRIVKADYGFGYHCTVSQFAAGAWTWPLDGSTVQAGNPLITLNNYWQ